MISKFKSFLMRGNVIDLAVGVIIGSAFGAIVNSLIENIITPLLLNPTLEAAGVASIEEWKPGGILLGKFIASVLSFVVIAFVLFLIIQAMEKMTKQKESAPAAPTAPSEEIVLLREIRDSLKK
jgi:large conductance mechanosensitive channel